MNVAAIYSRKSSDEGAAAAEDRSVTRQIEHGREFAQSKGWTVPDELVFVDDGVSGAEFSARPGFVRLMASLTPKPPFQYLVMSEESRLGREQIETSYSLKLLVQAGVEVWVYLENKRVSLDSPLDKVLSALSGFASELERSKAAARTKDALTRKARAGFVTGGRTFGYDNVEVLGPDGERSHVERRINEAEAATVRRIFEQTAAGFGKYRLAKMLNEEGAPTPRPQQGRPAGWAPSSIGAVLHRDLYRGVVVWNKSRKRDAFGQVAQRSRPQEEWMEIPAPELAIITPELWAEVHERLAATRATYLRHQDGKLWGKPCSGEARKHLLIGLAVCASCGAGLEVSTRSNGKGRPRSRFYRCSAARRKGPAVCQVTTEIPMRLADHAVTSTLLDDVLDAEVLARVAERAVELDREERQKAPDLREDIERQLRDAEKALERLTAAVASGGDVPALVEAIKAQEATRKRLEGRLATLEAPPLAFDATFEAHLRSSVEEWREVLGRQTVVARQVMTKLLDGRLRFQPEELDGRQGFRFQGSGSVERLISGAVPGAVLAGVSPTGFEPVLPA